MAEQTPPFFPACPDPVTAAITALQDQFRQYDRDIDQILNGTPAAATGSFSFCNGLLPPFDWGVPPISTVTFSPEGVVKVTPATIDTTKAITIGGVSAQPFIDFSPQDPKSGTFGKLEANKHFSSKKMLTGQYSITAATRALFFSTYNSFTSADVGKWIEVPFSAYPGNLGTHQITEVTNSQTIVCGGISTFVDEIALTSATLTVRMFNSDDASYGRLLTLSGTSNDGKYQIATFVSDHEVVLTMPVAPTPYEGNLTWAVSYNINELGFMIATSPPFTNHPQVIFAHTTPTISITAKDVGAQGNNIPILIGTGLTTFLCPSGPMLTGGMDGDLLDDIATANDAIDDVFSTTDPILSLGGTSSNSVSFLQNSIPPTVTNLSARLDACGFPSVAGTPIAHGTPRMKGYIDFIELCGIEALRTFLSTSKSGDRYVVSIDLVPAFIATPESCGTSEEDTLNEVPLCGITPAEAPEAIRYYVFHNTEVVTSSGAINTLFTQGFTSDQVSVILNPKGDIGFGVTSIVLEYPTAIEEALFQGYTLDDILAVLNKGIDDWKYDASPAELRAEITKLRVSAIASAITQGCFIRYWGGLNGDKLSGAGQATTNIDLSICDIVSIALKTAVKFCLNQMGKVNKTINKVNDVIKSLSSALSFSDFVNNTLAGYPTNPTLKCLLGSINLSALNPAGLVGGIVGASPTDMVSTFADYMNPKINLGATATQAVLGRAMMVLDTASKSVCLLQSTASSLVENSLGPAAAKVFDCLAPGLNLSLPQCALDSLNELMSLLDSIQLSINLGLSIASNLVAATAKIAKMDIADTGAGPSKVCPDTTVSSFVNALKSPLSL